MRIYAKGQAASHPGHRAVSPSRAFVYCLPPSVSSKSQKEARVQNLLGSTPGPPPSMACWAARGCRTCTTEWQTCITWSLTGAAGSGRVQGRRASVSWTRSRRRKENRATQGRAREKKPGPQFFFQVNFAKYLEMIFLFTPHIFLKVDKQ